MKTEEFYKKVHWFPGLKMEDKYDKHAEVFDYHDLIDFATQFSEHENKELREYMVATLNRIYPIGMEKPRFVLDTLRKLTAKTNKK
jgi:hypothetical protein